MLWHHTGARADRGHRQVTDAQLLTPARRHGTRLVRFDPDILALAQDRDVELLAAIRAALAAHTSWYGARDGRRRHTGGGRA